MNKKEIHSKRLLKVIEKRKNKVWSLTNLKEEINILLPRNIEIDRIRLGKLIRFQQTYKVFRCKTKEDTYYIFRKTLKENV